MASNVLGPMEHRRVLLQQAQAVLRCCHPLRRTRSHPPGLSPRAPQGRQPRHDSPVLDGSVGATVHEFRTWVTASGPVIREVLRYRAFALLAIALGCLIGLIIIRGRRWREAARGFVRVPLEAEAARGRHAVAGPAGSGESRTVRPDFTRLALLRRGVPDPAIGRPGPGTRRPGGGALDESARSGSSPDGRTASYTPAEAANAAHGPSIWDTPPGTLQAWGVELGDNGIRKNSAGPPWESAEKPPGEPPRVPTGPWAADRDGPGSARGPITDIPPLSSPDDNGH